MAIYIPSPGPDAWKHFLAEPTLHWKTGYSARAVAHSWESASGLPSEIERVLGGSTELLIAMPEHKVPLPGGSRPSQCDVFALVRQRAETIALAVEGKVNEPFGPTVEEWLGSDAGAGRLKRLDFICGLLGLTTAGIPVGLRYQLFHRTAAAIIEAGRFNTDRAAMIVQSFSPTGMWFEDFAAFAALFGATAQPDAATTVSIPGDVPLTIGWAKGDARFLEA